MSKLTFYNSLRYKYIETKNIRGERLMFRELVDYLRQALFQMRWLFMSPRRRYVYLWQRTKNSELKSRRG